MNKRTKDKEARDKCIVRLYFDRLSHGEKKMDAYAYVADWYGLTEDSVRKIVLKSKSGKY